jgi:tRNA nucleotidyltransferase (CCA-adding enzyme)
VHPVHTAEQVLERLASLPGGPELLAQARRREDVALVGGAVRDLLLGHWPRELDVTVAADAAGLARELAASVSPGERAYGRQVEPVIHERFGTASLAWQYGRIDVAERRAETYSAPGALPDVRPGSFEEDLRRRDFTVNAIALPLHGAENEGLVAVEGALDDLRAGVLRVLHGRSFLDDPTRILRLARYSARLGFEIEPHTRELAEQAVVGGALGTVSGERIGAELWLAAREADGRAAFRVLDSLGVLGALGMPPLFDDALARDAEALLPPDGSRETLLIGVALYPGGPDGAAWQIADALGFTREQSAAVAEVANGAEPGARILLGLPGASVPALDGTRSEVVAVAGALAARQSDAAAQAARDWFATHRHVSLDIDGRDLIAAGIPEGPEIGLRLARTLQAKREGLVSGREEELRAALGVEVSKRVETR